jgi:hypothetical protein
MKLQILAVVIITFLAVSLSACGLINFHDLQTGQTDPSVPQWHKAGCSASSSISGLKRDQYPSTPTPSQKDALCE